MITQRFGLLGMNDTVVKEVGSRKIEVDVSAVDMIGFDAASAAFVATTVGYMEARPVIATVTGTSSKWNSTTPTCSGSAWSSASLAPR